MHRRYIQVTALLIIFAYTQHVYLTIQKNHDQNKKLLSKECIKYCAGFGRSIKNISFTLASCDSFSNWNLWCLFQNYFHKLSDVAMEMI